MVVADWVTMFATSILPIDSPSSRYDALRPLRVRSASTARPSVRSAHAQVAKEFFNHGAGDLAINRDSTSLQTYLLCTIEDQRTERDNASSRVMHRRPAVNLHVMEWPCSRSQRSVSDESGEVGTHVFGGIIALRSRSDQMSAELTNDFCPFLGALQCSLKDLLLL